RLGDQLDHNLTGHGRHGPILRREPSPASHPEGVRRTVKFVSFYRPRLARELTGCYPSPGVFSPPPGGAVGGFELRRWN
ncbi:MAG: hypothetical protein KDA60_22730, partial [Planctomycetales bacterium]|nr:hypothetical protein [Planctomycetales bacterium]